MYPYGTKGAPAVGGGLPGLPRRGEGAPNLTLGSTISTDNSSPPLGFIRNRIVEADKYPELYAATLYRQPDVLISQATGNRVSCWRTKGQILLNGSDSGSVDVYRPIGGGFVKIAGPAFPGTSGALVDMAWSPTEDLVAVLLAAGGAGALKVFRFDEDDLTFTLVATPDIPTGTTAASVVKWSPNGEFLAVGFTSTTAASRHRVYRKQPDYSFALLGAPTLRIGANACLSLTWTKDSNMVIFGGSSSTAPATAAWWVPEVGNPSNNVSLPSVSSPAYDLGFHPQKPIISLSRAGSGSGVYFYEYSEAGAFTLQSAWTLTGMSNNKHAWSPSGRFLTVMSLSQNSLLGYFFGDSGPEFLGQKASFTATSSQPRSSVKYSPDELFLAVDSLETAIPHVVFGVSELLGDRFFLPAPEGPKKFTYVKAKR